ncbi:MAG: putative acyl-CoA dehydrogenase [Parcubacteria group bacterium Gr01-1014_19]|nr:MAG: putative acyl-CoA dehydrogenase [Parcubacteria group bacterium Gr01-1014_19]
MGKSLEAGAQDKDGKAKEKKGNDEEAMELMESLREKEAHTGFIANLMMGKYKPLSPFPLQPEKDKRLADEWLSQFANFLAEKVDPNKIDADGDMSDEVLDGLRKLTAFGIKVPKEYGGLGFSQSNYRRAATLFGSWCGNTSALLSAHNSLGATLPLMKYGTDEQKRRWLPKLAAGAISAFALTENGVGSDPSKMRAYARRVYNSKGEIIGYRLTAEKLYTTNAVRHDNVALADLVIVIARIVDDPKEIDTKGVKKKYGLFVVEKETPGYKVGKRCHFKGLRSIFNGETLFKEVELSPNELIGADGAGLEIAFKILTIGRLTIAAICEGALKQALRATCWWAKNRVQFDLEIGKHELNSRRIVDMASKVLVLEAVSHWCSSMIDKNQDIRIESGASKIISTEILWESLMDLFMIRGGRGFETYYSLQHRGETPVAVERMLRDCDINLIFEGPNPIMRMMVAREGLAEYIWRGMKMTNKKNPASLSEKAKIGFWFFKQYVKNIRPGSSLTRKFGSHKAFMAGEAKKLVRDFITASLYHQDKMKFKELIMEQIANRGTDMFEMSLVLSWAEAHPERPMIKELAEYYCRRKREKLYPKSFVSWMAKGTQNSVYRLASRIMDGEAGWLTDGIMPVDLPDLEKQK